MLLSNYNFYRVKDSMHELNVCLSRLWQLFIIVCTVAIWDILEGNNRGRSRKIPIRVLQPTSWLFQIVRYNSLL